MRGCERPGKRGMVFPPSWQGERYTPAEEEAHERLQEAEGERAPADDETTVERVAQAIRRTRMARVSAGVSRETAAADYAYARAALSAVEERAA